MNLNNILDKIPIYTVIATPTKKDVIELLDLFCNNGWKVDYYGRNPGIWYKHKTNTVFVIDKYHILTLDSLIFIRDNTKLFLWNEIKKKYMETIIDMNKKEIRIDIPKGYYIDESNSTFECIKLKPIGKLTYEAIMNKLFIGKSVYFPDTSGWVGKIDYEPCMSVDPNNCVSEKQVEKLFAINKLINVATYLNDGWTPDWNNTLEFKYCFSIYNNRVKIDSTWVSNMSFVYFRTGELAEQAIEILGEDIVKLALSTDGLI